MTEPGDARVAVYIDFDNIVISRYDQVHGRNQFQKDRARGFGAPERASDPEIAERLERAIVDIGAIIDFASSFGTLVLTRAYADWSAAVNADYRGQLVARAVDLVQLFPAAAYAKNGADIRLAVDAVEDMFRLPDLTHVVIVAGDSDYIALAQRSKRLGRYVVGIGVAGSTSKALAAACDEFVTYDAIPGITPPAPATEAGTAGRRTKSGTKRGKSVDRDSVAEEGSSGATAAESDGGAGAASREVAPQAAAAPKRAPRRAKSPVPQAEEILDVVEEDDEDDLGSGGEDPEAQATRLLERALRLGHEKDDAEWLHSSAVKTQMKRMDPSFSERALGFRTFSDFIKSRDDLAELDETTTARLLRLRPERASAG